ncbi:MAG: hypothetical protein AAFZ15_24915 [Bacteroidota bacterium]
MTDARKPETDILPEVLSNPLAKSPNVILCRDRIIGRTEDLTEEDLKLMGLL